jgi:ABC-type branched-subunit amino acid transport system substrate-binding protein
MLGNRVAQAIEQVLGAAGVVVRRYDDRGEPGSVSEAVVRAVTDRCVAILGGLGDDEARMVADAAASREIPLLSLGAAQDGRARKGVTWARTRRGDVIATLARRLAGAEKVTTAYILAPSTRFGLAAVDAFKSSFEASGGRIAVVRLLGPDDTQPAAVVKTFAAQVAQVRAASACEREVIFLPMDADASRRWMGFMEAEGVIGTPQDPKCPRTIVAGTAQLSEPSALAINGAALEGIRFADVLLSGAADGVSVLEAEAADAARLLVGALRSKAQPGREDVRRALDAGVKVNGHTGVLASSRGQLTGRTIVTFTIRAGRPMPDED